MHVCSTRACRLGAQSFSKSMIVQHFEGYKKGDTMLLEGAFRGHENGIELTHLELFFFQFLSFPLFHLVFFSLS